MADQPPIDVTPPPDVRVAPGDLVLARGVGLPPETFFAQVTGARLGRLVIERCDGRATGPLSLRDVLCVYKPAGAPSSDALGPVERRRPTAQLKFEV